MKKEHLLAALLTAAMLTSCGSRTVSQTSSESGVLPTVVTASSADSSESASAETTVTDSAKNPENSTVTTESNTSADSSGAPSAQNDYSEENSELSSDGPSLIDISIFSEGLPGISVSYDNSCVYEYGSAKGFDFTLVLDLDKWEGNTSPEQLVTASQLFWECYPHMYTRFGTTSGAPKDVTLAVENEGYSPAYTMGDFVHLHDEWLRDYPEDFDCLTHEFAHVIQNGWDGEFCEYSDYIERFADFCRYEYAFRSGAFNDSNWTLWTPDYEGDLASSNRFFVWLDYTYSTPSKDIMLDFFRVCYEQSYPSDQWDSAWQEIFSGTALEGRSISDVWDEFASSDFAYLSSDGTYGTSELLSTYDIRSKIA